MGKVKQQSRRVLGWFWRKLPRYGKIVTPFVVVALVLYRAEAVVSLFS